MPFFASVIRQPTVTLCQGMSTIGFLISAIPILLLGLGGIEIAYWYQTHHIIRMALVEAARQASMNHARPETIEQSFEEALLPLFISKKETAEKRQRRYFEKIFHQTTLPAWRIIIKSPTPAHFQDFHRNDLDIAKQTGLYAIDNNYQREQHQTKGLGASSHASIYDANTLTLAMTYAYEPLLPGIKALLTSLSHLSSDNYSQQLLAHGLLPIRQKLSISMQSHPVAWPSLPSGKVITDNTVSTPTSAIRSPSSICQQGIWCKDSISSYSRLSSFKPYEQSQPSSSTPISTDTPPHSPIKSDVHPMSSAEHHNATGQNNFSSSHKEQHPLCGISLCCE